MIDNHEDIELILSYSVLSHWPGMETNKSLSGEQSEGKFALTISVWICNL